MTMHVRRFALVALLATAFGATPALAQQQAAAVASPAAPSVSQVDRPTFENSRVAARPLASAESATLAPAVQAQGLGRPAALMLVGFGALLAGAIIGDDVGTIFMVGGAVIGLYGLYEYLK